LSLEDYGFCFSNESHECPGNQKKKKGQRHCEINLNESSDLIQIL